MEQAITLGPVKKKDRPKDSFRIKRDLSRIDTAKSIANEVENYVNKFGRNLSAPDMGRVGWAIGILESAEGEHVTAEELKIDSKLIAVYAQRR